jgi:hypothetical protein|tara:strand:- start:1051 stop:1704 length:654 start_codon:yes stop_codon:yes gene_type:complete
MKEIDFTDQITQYKEEGLLADEKAGYPPNCKPGYEVSKDKKKCVPLKKYSDEAKTKEQYEKIDTKELKRDDKKEKKEHEKDALKDDADKIKKLKKGKPSEKKSVEIHDIKKDEKFDKKKLKAAKMTSKQKNDLPDSDFAYIEPGGKKDSEGKTVPRSLRHLPINDAAHVRNALARLDQTDISAEAKKAALKKIKAAAKKFGIKVSEASATIDYSDLY